MNRFLVAGLAVAALAAGPAVAADIPVKAPPSAPVAVVSWTGLYSGINVGYAWSDARWSFPAANFYGPAGTFFDTDPDGWLGGGQWGFNYQVGSFVLGAEVLWDHSSIKDRVVGPVAAFPADSFWTRVDDLILVTGRAGLASDKWLFYGKGGWASGEVSLRAVSGPPVANVFVNAKERLSGWTAGGGIEYMLFPAITLGLEYNYVRLDGDRFFGTTSVAGAFSADIDDVTLHTFLFRANYRFSLPSVFGGRN